MTLEDIVTTCVNRTIDNLNLDKKQVYDPTGYFVDIEQDTIKAIRQWIKESLPKEKGSGLGKNCVCMAHNESECCGCGADWSDNRKYNQALKDVRQSLGDE